MLMKLKREGKGKEVVFGEKTNKKWRGDVGSILAGVGST